MVDLIDPFATPSSTTPPMTDMPPPDADAAPAEAAPNRPPEPRPEPEEETDEQWRLRFIEENQHLARPRPERPPAPPPSPWDGPSSTWKVPDHLSLRHPKGGYMAMALLSRTMDDLDEITKGERAATYEEVDKYLGHALIAEGLVPFTYTADEAIRWWKAGGYKVLGSTPIVPPPAEAASDETRATRDKRATVSSIAMNANGMTIDGDEPLRTNETVGKDSASEPTHGVTSLTKPADMFRDIETWGTPKPVPLRATPRPAPAPSPHQTQAKPPVVAGAQPGALNRGWPVPGGGRTARQGQRDSRGKAYSDGSYDLTGRKRGGRKHKAYDLPGEIGTIISAAADGVVVTADPEREKIWTRDKAGVILRDKKGQKIFTRGKKVTGWGNYVIIQHADGYRTLYAHLREVPRLKKNDPVRLGQEIGRLGITGNAATKGSHLHFEVRDSRMSKTYNPGDWLAGRLPALRR